MVAKYNYKYANMEFSKDGQLDELIALDRYAVPTYDGYQVGDTVVAIVDQEMGSKKVGTITNIDGNILSVKDRLGDMHSVQKEHVHKPLELKPVEMWDRWALGGSSVEKTEELREYWYNKFATLMDAFGYSLGGRIQLMLGQEFVTGKRANLTAYNCFVAPMPKSLYDIKKLSIKGVEIPRDNEAFNVSGFSDGLIQFLEVMRVADVEASIMRRGGGVGINISNISTVEGSGATKTDFIFYLDKKHKDSKELLKRIKLGKFDAVTVITSGDELEAKYDELARKGKSVKTINAYDSVNEMFKENMNDMITSSYNGKAVVIDFNALRERNALVIGVNGRSSGSVSWMELFVLIAELLQLKQIDNVDFAEIFSHIVHLIIQGGSRRGALMLINSDDNPNVYKFMERKKEVDAFGKGKWLTGANISVGISDDFMDRVKEGKRLQEAGIDWISEDIQYALDLWAVLIESAWKSAEPGIVWMERYNKESNSWYFHEIVCTNPCGKLLASCKNQT